MDAFPASASRIPSLAASTNSSCAYPVKRAYWGAKRISAYSYPSPARSSVSSRAARRIASGVPSTLIGRSKRFRQATRSTQSSGTSRYSWVSSSKSRVGSSIPCLSASSITVAGRREPSRCRCSSIIRISSLIQFRSRLTIAPGPGTISGRIRAGKSFRAFVRRC